MEHSTDKIWSQIVIEAESAIQGEPNLKNFLNEKILSHESMKAALSCSITEIISQPYLRIMPVPEHSRRY